jgi:large exoprotein involved in heme utilization and adhesion
MNENYKYGVRFLTLLPWALAFGVLPVRAQVVPSATDGSLVNQSGGQFRITGGQVSGNRTNLFHSFDRFGLSQGQVANFVSNPQIRNIFGRVVGGEVSGGNANLFLMNPAGILSVNFLEPLRLKIRLFDKDFVKPDKSRIQTVILKEYT